MKLEDMLIQAQRDVEPKPLHMAGHSTLSLLKNGQRYIYLCDPISGEISRRIEGHCDHAQYKGILHGMGAVRG